MRARSGRVEKAMIMKVLLMMRREEWREPEGSKVRAVGELHRVLGVGPVVESGADSQHPGGYSTHWQLAVGAPCQRPPAPAIPSEAPPTGHH